MNKGHFFTSNLFEITRGEDEATNPALYGKNLAEWLCKKFIAIGYANAEVIPEDWGWRVMCSTKDIDLWVGCGAVETDALMNSYPKENPPKCNEVIWHVFPSAEIRIFKPVALIKKIMGKINSLDHENRFANELEQILKNEKSIIFCQEP